MVHQKGQGAVAMAMVMAGGQSSAVRCSAVLAGSLVEKEEKLGEAPTKPGVPFIAARV